MGYDTNFHGKLEFVHPLTDRDIGRLRGVMEDMGRCDLSINDDLGGLVYRSEKTYSMMKESNRLITEAKNQILGFGLKGMMAADTDFEPYLWFVKVDQNGRAYAEKTTIEEFLALKRKLYPNGYKWYGLTDPQP